MSIYFKGIKTYAILVCCFSIALGLLYSLIAIHAAYRIIEQPIKNVEEFTYEIAKSSVVTYSLSDHNNELFRNLTKEDFEKRPEHYFKIWKKDHKETTPKTLIETLVFLGLFIFLFIMHYRLYKRIR